MVDTLQNVAVDASVTGPEGGEILASTHLLTGSLPNSNLQLVDEKIGRILLSLYPHLR